MFGIVAAPEGFGGTEGGFVGEFVVQRGFIGEMLWIYPEMGLIPILLGHIVCTV